jgi:hypothetical protein
MRLDRPCLVAVVALAALVSASSAARAQPEAEGQKPAAIPRTPRPEQANLYVISPAEGETVASPVTIRFGLKGMGVAPAGVATPNTGHHHLLIDVDLPRLDQPVPKDDRHRHFGGGETEVTLELPPGRHVVQLVLADKDHVPHDPPLVSERIAFTVK